MVLANQLIVRREGRGGWIVWMLALGLGDRGVDDDARPEPILVHPGPHGFDGAAGIATADAGVEEIKPRHAAPDPEVHLVEGRGKGLDENLIGPGRSRIGPVRAKGDVRRN